MTYIGRYTEVQFTRDKQHCHYETVGLICFNQHIIRSDSRLYNFLRLTNTIWVCDRVPISVLFVTIIPLHRSSRLDSWLSKPPLTTGGLRENVWNYIEDETTEMYPTWTVWSRISPSFLYSKPRVVSS